MDTSTINEAPAVPTTEAPKSCDLSVICPCCETPMDREHAHMRCQVCGYRDSCCF